MGTSTIFKFACFAFIAISLANSMPSLFKFNPSIFSFLNLYEVKRYDERIVSDVEATSSLCKGIIKGFQNTEYLLDGSNHVIFNIEKGIGNNKTKLEGFTYKNFYATTMIGPILARNDNLNNYFIELLTKWC